VVDIRESSWKDTLSLLTPVFKKVKKMETESINVNDSYKLDLSHACREL
jgi:hypothetical protein